MSLNAFASWSICRESGESLPKLVVFERCSWEVDEWLFYDVSGLKPGDELVMVLLTTPSGICDKLVHGTVAYLSTLGFETISGTIMSFPEAYVDGVDLSRVFHQLTSNFNEKDTHMVRLFIRRPTPKGFNSNHRSMGAMRRDVEEHLFKLAKSRSIDSECCLCSEDLVGIKELQLVDSLFDPPEILRGNGLSSSSTTSVSNQHMQYASDWPQSRAETRLNKRVRSQPLQGHGYHPISQQRSRLRYNLTIVGVNQSGLLTFVHSLLLISGFRIVSGRIDTIRGSYAQNSYLLETYSYVSERLLRANFQCVVPMRLPPSGMSLLYQSEEDLLESRSRNVPLSTPLGYWFNEGLSSYFGELDSESRKHGFGRFWTAKDKQSLTSFTYEGDWAADARSGFGFELTDDGNKSVVYSFGVFAGGVLVEGVVVSPFDPPAKSRRICGTSGTDDNLYKQLIHRSKDFWFRQLPRRERLIPYLCGSKLRSDVASDLLSSWTLFSESPVPCVASADCCQVAALLEACGMKEAAKIAFSKRIDGTLIESMSGDQLTVILSLTTSQRNMFVTFLQVLSKAYCVDRHMRQPASVLDPLANPSVNGHFFPLDRMRVVDSLGEGSFGKVVYAEYYREEEEQRVPPESGGIFSKLKISLSSRSLSTEDLRATPAASRAGTPSSTSGRMYVALKEPVGNGLENSCELVREWATLNALPHANIVKLEGICGDVSAPMCSKRYLATALLEASLPSIVYAHQIYGSTAPTLTPRLTLQLAGDIAAGLAHMHSLFILHGDIKSPNVLVDLRAERPTARICDFGHASIRIGPRPQRRMCTFGWASPESLRDAETDLSSDVWSWAVVVWEMYSREIPWKNCSHPQMLSAVGYCGMSPEYFRPMPRRVKAEVKVAQLCQRIWTLEMEKRPSIVTALHVVEKLGRATAKSVFDDMHSLLRI